MAAVIACGALGGNVEITDEREEHIASRHPDLLPAHRTALIRTIEDPDFVADAVAGASRLLVRWDAKVRGGRHVIAVVVTDAGPVPRYWLVTAYLSRKVPRA